MDEAIKVLILKIHEISTLPVDKGHNSRGDTLKNNGGYCYCRDDSEV